MALVASPPDASTTAYSNCTTTKPGENQKLKHINELVAAGFSSTFINKIIIEPGMPYIVYRDTKKLQDKYLFDSELLENVFKTPCNQMSYNAYLSMQSPSGAFGLIDKLTTTGYKLSLYDLKIIAAKFGYEGLLELTKFDNDYHNLGFSAIEFLKLFVVYHDTPVILAPINIISLFKENDKLNAQKPEELTQIFLDAEISQLYEYLPLNNIISNIVPENQNLKQYARSLIDSLTKLTIAVYYHRNGS